MESQNQLQQKCEGVMARQIVNLQERLSAVEYGLFKTEDPDTRFTRLYDKLAGMEVTRVKDLEDSAYLRDNLNQKFDSTVFKIENKFKSLEIFKDSYEALCKRAADQMAHIDGFMHEQISKIQHYFRKMDALSVRTLDELEQIRNYNYNVVKFEFDKLTAKTNDHEERLTRTMDEVAQLQVNTTLLKQKKTDLERYEKDIKRI